jgi:hypothetical protein
LPTDVSEERTMKKWPLGVLAGVILALANGCSSAPQENTASQAEEGIVRNPEPGCTARSWLTGTYNYVHEFETYAAPLCIKKFSDVGSYAMTWNEAACSTSSAVWGRCPARGWGNESMDVYELAYCWSNVYPVNSAVTSTPDCVYPSPGYVALTWDPGCGSSCM